MTLLTALDLGTTTMAGVLLDVERGDLLHVASRPNDAALPVNLPTRAEQDPARLLTLALDVLSELTAVGRPVDGIALSGQMHGILCAGPGAQPLTPLITWQDRRTAEPLPGSGTMLDRLHAHVADLDWRRNGCRIHHGYGAATLFWWLQQQALPAGTHHVCDVAGWLAAQLTGSPPSMDPTLAASWGIYDLLDRAWNAPFLGGLGIDPRHLPPIHDSGVRVGGLGRSLAHRVGLVAGLPVYNPVGDNQASFLGTAVQAAGVEGLHVSGAVLLNLGTGGQVSWAVPHFQPPAEPVETRPLPGAGYLRVGASLCGGGAYAWLARTVESWLDEFGVEIDPEAILQKLNALARACPDSGGLRVRPTFLGVRGDPEIVGGAIEGIPFDALRLGPLARATLVGIVDELYNLYAAHGGPSAGAARLIAAGGAVRRNPLLMELMENRFDLPALLADHPAPGAAGAAHLAALSAH